LHGRNLRVNYISIALEQSAGQVANLPERSNEDVRFDNLTYELLSHHVSALSACSAVIYRH
jgi:hypothetical protein